MQYGMRLDTRSHVFQNLNGAEDEVELVLEGDQTYPMNSVYRTRAAVYHGNGASKVIVL